MYELLKEIVGRPMGPREKLFLLSVAQHVNSKRKDGKAWPCHQEVAETMGKSKKAVQRAARACVAKGWVTYLPGRGRTSSQYRFVHSAWTCLSTQGGHQGPPEQSKLTENLTKQILVPDGTKEKMTSEEIAQKLQEKIKATLDKPAGEMTHSQVVHGYKAWVSHFCGVAVGQVEFTQVQGKIIKDALKKVPHLGRCLWYATAKWPVFSAFVASNHGLKSLPNYPTIKWISVYLDDLVAFDAEQAGKPEMKPASSSKLKWL